MITIFEKQLSVRTPLCDDQEVNWLFQLRFNKVEMKFTLFS